MGYLSIIAAPVLGRVSTIGFTTQVASALVVRVGRMLAMHYGAHRPTDSKPLRQTVLFVLLALGGAMY